MNIEEYCQNVLKMAKETVNGARFVMTYRYSHVITDIVEGILKKKRNKEIMKYFHLNNQKCHEKYIINSTLEIRYSLAKIYYNFFYFASKTLQITKSWLFVKALLNKVFLNEYVNINFTPLFNSMA